MYVLLSRPFRADHRFYYDSAGFALGYLEARLPPSPTGLRTRFSRDGCFAGQVGAQASLRRYADTPIRRYADTPPRRYADTPLPLRLQISKRADVGGSCLFRQMVDWEEREEKLGDPVCFL